MLGNISAALIGLLNRMRCDSVRPINWVRFLKTALPPVWTSPYWSTLLPKSPLALMSVSSWRDEPFESDLVKAIFSSSSRECNERRDPKTEVRFDFCNVLGRALGLDGSDSTGLDR